MKSKLKILAAIVIYCACGSAAYSQSPEMEVILSAAEALGGVEAVENLETVRIAGHGQIAYQNGGGNSSGSPTAAQKWVNLVGVVRNIDLRNWRMELQQRQVHNFVFAYANSMSEGRRVHQVVDGDVAFSSAEDGQHQRLDDMTTRELRIQMLVNPVSMVRAAMEEGSTLTNLRTEDGHQVMDFTSPWGDELVLAFEESGRPAWVRWVEPQENLGELVNTAHFEAYQRWNGIFMPTSYNVVSDWRNVSQYKLYVDITEIGVEVEDLSAPAAVRSAPAPVRELTAEAEAVADGVWLISGNGGANSILFEFDDHLTVFETPSSDEWTKEILETARETVPGKPLTQAIVSHHHFDHSGGVRQAVAEGLTIITHEGNADILGEMTSRRTQVFHDDQGRDPQPLDMIPVSDSLVLEDDSLRVELYTTVAMNHMPHGVFAYVPHAELLVQADMFDTGWDVMWWGGNYMDNIRYRDLDVALDVPVHGIVLPFEQVQREIDVQVQNAQDLCERVDEAGFSMQGCPVHSIPR